MPVHSYTVKAGTKQKLLLVYARTATQGAPRTGLASALDGATAAYVRDDDGIARPVTLVPARPGRHVPGGFTEVDPDLTPGLYQFGAPDEMLAPGATRVLLLFRFANAVIEPVDVDLVAYDAQDGDHLGIEALGSARRHAFLRRALPRLTEQELAMGEPGERELARRASVADSDTPPAG